MKQKYILGIFGIGILGLLSWVGVQAAINLNSDSFNFTIPSFKQIFIKQGGSEANTEKIRLDEGGIYTTNDAIQGTAGNIIKLDGTNTFTKTNISSNDIGSGVVTGAHIANNAITTEDIADGAITNITIATGSLGTGLFTGISFVSGGLYYYTLNSCPIGQGITAIVNGAVQCATVSLSGANEGLNCVDGQTPMVDENGNWVCGSILLGDTTDGDMNWDTSYGYTCITWYDGCNTNSIDDNGMIMSTQRYCEPYERTEGYCIEKLEGYSKPKSRQEWTMWPTPYSAAPSKDIWNANRDIPTNQGYTCTQWQIGCTQYSIEGYGEGRFIMQYDNVRCPPAQQGVNQCTQGHEGYDGDIDGSIPPFSYPAGAPSGVAGKVGVGLTTPTETLTATQTVRVDNNGGSSAGSIYCMRTDRWVSADQYSMSACAVCESDGFVYSTESNRCEKAVCIDDGDIDPGVACGPANGKSYTKTPDKNILCSAGKVLEEPYLIGDKHLTWRWSCANEKETVYCRAYYTATQGVCGAADGKVYYSAPSNTSDLCADGVPSAVTGTDPWTWSCQGTDGIASCSTVKAPAQANTDAKCGGIQGTTMSAPPSNNTCLIGNQTAILDAGTKWTWSCQSPNGGLSASCRVNKTVMVANGTCGSANGQTTSIAPSTNLCSNGNPTAIIGSGPWTWSCQGLNGGTAASCESYKSTTPINGVCGSANGGTFKNAPSSNLCNAGIATTVVGSGPWTWSCQGLNGGTTAACSAENLKIKDPGNVEETGVGMIFTCSTGNPPQSSSYGYWKASTTACTPDSYNTFTWNHGQGYTVGESVCIVDWNTFQDKSSCFCHAKTNPNGAQEPSCSPNVY